MDFIESFEKIVRKDRLKQVIPFLQNLSSEQRRKLAPHLIALEKEYSAFVQNGNTWQAKQTQSQRLIFIYAAIACLNKKEFSKNYGLRALEPEYLSKVLPWYVPAWLGEFINSESKLSFLPRALDYDFIMQLTAAGHIQPTPELLASALVRWIIESKNRVHHFRPEKLWKYPETLTTHLWHVFSYETSIWFDYKDFTFENYAKGQSPVWIDVFVMLAQEGKLDRMKLLQEASLAANRNFNKNLSTWFSDLFVALAPTTEELLKLQPELFSLLNAPYSKPVGTSLAMLKKIASEDNFDSNSFLGYLPVVTASPVKTNVAASLSISEAIWKTNKALGGDIAPLICGVFIHRDETIQSRAAKLLIRFSKTAAIDISDIVTGYGQTLMSIPRSLLQPFMQNGTVPGDPAKAHDGYSFEENASLQQNILPLEEDGQILKEAVPFTQDDGSLSWRDNQLPPKDKNDSTPSLLPIEPVNSFEDFIFLLSQVLDNNESWHLDHAAAAILKFQSELDADKINQLLPAFQRCWKFVTVGWSSGSGFLDNLFAYFMIDVGMVVIKAFPSEAVRLRLLYDQSLAKVPGWEKQWHQHGTNLSFLCSANLKTNEQFYEPVKQLLAVVLDHFKRNIAVPLLSTPTHAPGWVDPNILVSRLRVYQEMNIEPNRIDFQFAIARCSLSMVSADTITALRALPVVYRDLLSFLFGQEVEDAWSHRSDALWVMAAICKDPEKVGLYIEGGSYQDIYMPMLNGQYPWNTGKEDYKVPKYEYVDGRYDKTIYQTATRKVLQLQTRDTRSLDLSTSEKPGVLQGLFRKLFRSSEKLAPVIESEKLLYQYLVVNSHEPMTLHNDTRRLVMMIPNNPEPFIAIAINKCLKADPFAGEMEKRLAVSVLQAMLDLPIKYKETSTLFIAGCLTGNDKTVASYAAEVWMKAVLDNAVDSKRLGYILGSLYAIEYAPMKRFTDLVINQLLNVSSMHNQRLEQMLTALILQLPTVPPKGLKKLLEVFFEVLSSNQAVVGLARDRDIITILNYWQTTAGLQKIISRIKTLYDSNGT